MPAADIANILSRLTSKPDIAQEGIWGSGELIQPSEYVGNGEFRDLEDATKTHYNAQAMSKSMCAKKRKGLVLMFLCSRFRYTTALKNAFSGGGISSLQNLDSRGVFDLFFNTDNAYTPQAGFPVRS
jgi:hypothetical protein